ncbi:sigma-70 family RNA polymerase sigma factor [Parafrankia elaeagni]|uniref:sigma-70 family RNA polymerase sigma factor n=1 Tax=Parafrankia elaeagni TaxID=222534 RepID=UPI001E456D2C|nr:sigma-70 family RNA polymerase sigma factor [Parafrankia elaeagni]
MGRPTDGGATGRARGHPAGGDTVRLLITPASARGGIAGGVGGHVPRATPVLGRLLALLPLLGTAAVMSRATAGNATRIDASEPQHPPEPTDRSNRSDRPGLRGLPDLMDRPQPAAVARPPDPRVDADLVQRARRGEREAFGQIYDRYADFVYRFAFYRVGGNRAVAEDVVSETFLRALTRISTFEWQGRDIGAWLVTIARNHIVDLARSGRARLEFPAADLFTTAESGVGLRTSVPGPEDTVLSALSLRDLLQAVSSLGSEQRECVTLRFLEGLSVRETAQAMNKKEGAVRALQLRAVRALARSLPTSRGD